MGTTPLTSEKEENRVASACTLEKWIKKIRKRKRLLFLIYIGQNSGAYDCLPFHIDHFTKHGIDSGHNFRVSLESPLGSNHLYEFVGNIYIRLF